jgi:hypothetical protein
MAWSLGRPAIWTPPRSPKSREIETGSNITGVLDMPCTRVIMPACCVASRVVALCIVDPRPEGCGRQPRGPSGRLPPDGLAARRRSHRARDLQLDRRLRVATAWQMSTPMSLGRAVALLALRTAIGASVALLSVRMRFMVAVLVGQYLQRGNLCHFVKVGG